MDPPYKRSKMEVILPKDTQSTDSMDAQSTDSLESSFRRDIRPMLDVVDRIRAQGVTEENIQLPTIVVVGDQDSGKSSVLESLAGITLPRGQGIATRVPLVLRLQSCGSDRDSIITIDYGDVKDQVIDSENHIEAAINYATTALAGSNKGVKDSPIQLLIRKLNAPDLTMVDLPGITRVAVHGQPENIYVEIHGMIMRYITPDAKSIVLNVLSAQVDNFSTCESIRMLQQLDKRTLAVITKVDKAPEGLLEKVTTDAVNIGFGYVCVRNRTDSDDSIAIARLHEKELFESHPALRELEGSMVGIPALARKLTTIQSDMVKGCLPRIEKQLHEALLKRSLQLNKFPKEVKSSSDARSVFYQVLNNILSILSQVVREGNFAEFPNDAQLCYPARLQRMFQNFADELHEAGAKFKDELQTEEIADLIAENQGVALPNFLPHPVLHYLMKKQIKDITGACTELVEETFECAMEVVLHIITFCGQGYPRLVKLYKQILTNTLEEMKKSTMTFVRKTLEKESSMIFTTNDYYTNAIRNMNAALRKAQRDTHGHITPMLAQSGAELQALYVSLGGTDNISLKEMYNKDRTFQDAWRMKVSAAAYWKVVQKRLADEIPLEIKFTLQRTIVDGLHEKMMNHPWSAGSDVDMLALMEEDALAASNRSRLQRRVDLLKDCLLLLSGVMH